MALTIPSSLGLKVSFVEERELWCIPEEYTRYDDCCDNYADPPQDKKASDNLEKASFAR